CNPQFQAANESACSPGGTPRQSGEPAPWRLGAGDGRGDSSQVLTIVGGPARAGRAPGRLMWETPRESVGSRGSPSPPGSAEALPQKPRRRTDHHSSATGGDAHFDETTPAAHFESHLCPGPKTSSA